MLVAIRKQAADQQSEEIPGRELHPHLLRVLTHDIQGGVRKKVFRWLRILARSTRRGLLCAFAGAGTRLIRIAFDVRRYEFRTHAGWMGDNEHTPRHEYNHEASGEEAVNRSGFHVRHP